MIRPLLLLNKSIYKQIILKKQFSYPEFMIGFPLKFDCTPLLKVHLFQKYKFILVVNKIIIIVLAINLIF